MIDYEVLRRQRSVYLCGSMKKDIY